jgi:hypothetical protein
MKEAMAIASIAILFGITDANANSAPTVENTLQVAQKAATKQAKRLHPVTGKRLHPAVYKKGAYRHHPGTRSARRRSSGGAMQQPASPGRTPERGTY